MFACIVDCQAQYFADFLLPGAWAIIRCLDNKSGDNSTLNMSSNGNQRPGKAIGQGMIAAGFVVALGFMTFLFNGILGDQTNPNQRPLSSINSAGIREVTLERNRQGHYVSTGKINDISVEFLLDTGATDVVIPGDLAQRANLEPGYEGRAITANGYTTVYDTQIDQLELGSIVLRDIDASIAPGMGGEIILLGMSVLQKIEFSQSGSVLVLKQYPD